MTKENQKINNILEYYCETFNFLIQAIENKDEDKTKQSLKECKKLIIN